MVGLALLAQLVRAVFDHSEVKSRLECGLNRHNADGIHRQHCGEQLEIETEWRGGS